MFFALRAQRKGTINSFLSKKGYGESFLSKNGYNKVNKIFALRAQRKGTIESFISKTGYSKMKNCSKTLNQIYHIGQILNLSRMYSGGLLKHAGGLGYIR